MSAGWLGGRTVRLRRCGSTNDEAAALAAAGAAHGTVVVADEQSGGRGRQGRAWHSPPGQNLYVSCLLRPHGRVASVPPITLAAGVAVADAVNFFTVRPSLKWPNDVLARRRKLAGVLTEMQSRADQVEHVIVGVGVNVNGDPESFPPDLRPHVTSIRIERAEPVDRDDVLARLLAELERWLDRFFAGGVAAVAPAWLERADRALRVRAHSAAGPVEGRPVGIGPGGELLVADDRGHTHLIAAGDVERA